MFHLHFYLTMRTSRHFCQQKLDGREQHLLHNIFEIDQCYILSFLFQNHCLSIKNIFRFKELNNNINAMSQVNLLILQIKTQQLNVIHNEYNKASRHFASRNQMGVNNICCITFLKQIRKLLSKLLVTSQQAFTGSKSTRETLKVVIVLMSLFLALQNNNHQNVLERSNFLLLLRYVI